ncbi:MAG: hypothetical protein SPJ34_03785, partial [Candidatus Ornithospirochaeta sp.]|nr:hypothetical protein [Candidatus Ornithospirochaeta sp.]
MKRITAILLSVMMIACLAISCDNNAASDAKAETVSISFAEARSRSLTASIAEFDASKYYWGYAARKTDSTGLKAGETAFRWVKTGDDDPGINDTGIANVTIPGFSQGAWEFTLYAYTADSRDSLAYTGMTNTVLEKGNTNAIAVTVSPVSEGEGTLFVDISRITIKPAREGSALSGAQQDSFVKEVSVTRMPSGVTIEALEPSEGIEKYTYSTEPGAYKVSVALKQNGILYASGSVVATVYSNLTTTVKGDLLE